jgi:hypothetical protein
MELRWKRAELARKLLDDVFADDDAAQGFYMLDGLNYPYKDWKNEAIDVEPEDIRATLNKALATQQLDDKEARVLFCLDSVLYFLNRIGNPLTSKLILFEDIATPCEYYVGLIAQHKRAFSQYALSVGYRDLLGFFERFSVWASHAKTKAD